MEFSAFKEFKSLPGSQKVNKQLGNNVMQLTGRAGLEIS